MRTKKSSYYNGDHYGGDTFGYDDFSLDHHQMTPLPSRISSDSGHDVDTTIMRNGLYETGLEYSSTYSPDRLNASNLVFNGDHMCVLPAPEPSVFDHYPPSPSIGPAYDYMSLFPDYLEFPSNNDLSLSTPTSLFDNGTQQSLVTPGSLFNNDLSPSTSTSLFDNGAQRSPVVPGFMSYEPTLDSLLTSDHQLVTQFSDCTLEDRPLSESMKTFPPPLPKRSKPPTKNFPYSTFNDFHTPKTCLENRLHDSNTIPDPSGLLCASRLNPKNMKYNCVSVAIAHLEQYAAVDDLWKACGRSFPDRPLTIPEITSLLRDIGWSYDCDIFDANGGRTAFQMLQEKYRYCKHVPSFALYIRPNGDGHAVNLFYKVLDYGPLRKTEYELQFIDYQHSTGGAICNDITQARRIYIFWRNK